LSAVIRPQTWRFHLDRFRRSLRDIYSPRYILLNIVLLPVYFVVYFALIAYQNDGIPSSVFPFYWIGGLVLTSSMLATIAIYSIRNTMNNRARLSASSWGTTAAIAGGVIGGCGCGAPLVLNLVTIGVSAGDAIALNNFLVNYQEPIFLALIAMNIGMIVYYLNRLSTSACKMPILGKPQ
jgi:hypothetical protein